MAISNEIRKQAAVSLATMLVRKNIDDGEYAADNYEEIAIRFESFYDEIAEKLQLLPED